MNKFETRLLETLSSIDESLKALAAGKALAAKPAAAKAPKKKIPKSANGALPKMAAKAAEAVEKGQS